LVQQLYDVERDAADLDPERRRALRQERSMPLLAKIDAERQALSRTVLPKSSIGDAVRHLTNQWAALQRFTEDGRLAIDNTARKISCASSPLVARIGYSPAASKAPAGPPCSIRSFRAAS